MTRLTTWVTACFLSLFITSSFAAIDTYQFKDADKQVRFQKLTNELRCPKCQNQNLADSNAEIASDLRAKIHQMLEAEQSDEAIIAYMLARYGEFVLYQPRLSKQTVLLWTAPAVLLLMGGTVIVLIVRFRNNTADKTAAENQLTPQQQQKLAALLDNKQGTSQ
jgi:cytochrome c-type biogenesis protein CcmH